MPDLGGRVDFVFAFVETEFPYAINVAPLDRMLPRVRRASVARRRGALVERAASELARRARRTIGPTLGRGSIFHHNQGRFEAPGWLLARMEG